MCSLSRVDFTHKPHDLAVDLSFFLCGVLCLVCASVSYEVGIWAEAWAGWGRTVCGEKLFSFGSHFTMCVVFYFVRMRPVVVFIPLDVIVF